MAAVVYAGAVAPESLKVTVAQGSSGIDLTTVTAAQLLVKKPDGTTLSWSATISAATATSLTLTHVFSAADVDVTGIYVVVPKLTVPAGFVRGVPKKLTALDPFQAE